MFQVRAVFEHDLCDGVREVAALVTGHKILNQRCGTVFFCDDEHARESSAVCSSTNKRDLQRFLELHVLRNVNKNSRLDKSRIECCQSIVVITRVARKILANNLVIACVINRTEQIRCNNVSECGRHRQLFIQETVHNYEMSAICLGKCKTI